MIQINDLCAETVYHREIFNGLQGTGRELAQLTFRQCRFEGCDFSECRWPKTRFIGCEFVECNLSLTELKDCSLNEVVFRECKLIGVNWSTAALLKKLSFYDSILNYGTFLGVTLPKTVFENCVCQNVYFAESNFAGSRFSGTDLQEAQFAQVDLRRADFRRAKNYMLSPMANQIVGGKFVMPEALALLYGLEIELED